MADSNRFENQMRFAKLCVLVVEDAEFDRTLIVSTLKKIGVGSIQVAENGRIATTKIENAMAVKKPFDIVFLDSKMPVQDGMSLLKWMRKDLKLQKQIVIMTTGTSERSEVAQFIDQEVSGFILKPVTARLLEDKIVDALERTAKKHVKTG